MCPNRSRCYAEGSRSYVPNEIMNPSRAMSILIILVLIGTCLSILPEIGADSVLPSRAVDGEKGSQYSINFGTSDLSDVMINNDDHLELAQEDNSITEEFDNLNNAEYSENLMALSGDSKVQHFFRNTYGTTANSETAQKCIRTSDGGYVITGSVYNLNTRDDLLLMKLDQNGNHLWTRTFSGMGIDVGYDVMELSGNDLIIVGEKTPISTKYTDVWLIRTCISSDRHLRFILRYHLQLL